MNDKNNISWMALQYEYTEENIRIQIGFTFLMGCIFVGTLIYKNYLLSIIILFWYILYKYKIKDVQQYAPVEINKQGISVNNQLTLHDAISTFYIDEYEDVNYLLYRLKNTMINPTKVIIIEPEVDIDELRAFLLQHLTEKEIKQNSTDKLMNAF